MLWAVRIYIEFLVKVWFEVRVGVTVRVRVKLLVRVRNACNVPMLARALGRLAKCARR